MWSRNRTYKLVIGVFCVLCITVLYSFSQLEKIVADDQEINSINPLVQQKLKEKLDKFKNSILDKCKREAIEEAEKFVDSLVSEELKILSGDTMYFPAKPVRPGLPKKIILNDSTAIDPIIKQ